MIPDTSPPVYGNTSNVESWDAMVARLQREREAMKPKPKDFVAIEAERDALKAENEKLRRNMASIRTSINTAIAVNMTPGNKPWSTQHWCEFVDGLV